MKDTQVADKLYKEGAINEAAYQKISAAYSGRLFSIGFELKTILYLGILLLTSGLGVLVYKNIDSIGHLAVISFIALVSLACLSYSYMKRQPYSNQKVNSPAILPDYVLLLGCLTFATFMGYLQYQYSAFGPHNEIAFLIPAIIFFAITYRFDHIGILSMAITALAGFVGIAITPLQLLSNNDFGSQRIILSGLGLGAVLIGTALYLNKKEIKKHFTFTYLNFSIHLLFIASIAALFSFDIWFLFLLLLGIFVFLLIRYSYQEKSFYFFLFAIIYGYFGVSFLFFKLMFAIHLDDTLIFLVPSYFIGTSAYAIILLRNTNKKFKPHDSL